MFHKVTQLQENYMSVEYNDICSLQGSHQHITGFDIYLLAICYPIMTKLNIFATIYLKNEILTHHTKEGLPLYSINKLLSDLLGNSSLCLHCAGPKVRTSYDFRMLGQLGRYSYRQKFNTKLLLFET